MTEQPRLPGGRTYMCGGLRAGHAGEVVDVAGWVARQRDHGGVVFFDLRDRDGLVQVVAHPEEAPDAHVVASDLKQESVVRVRGTVRLRPEGTANPNLPTGEVEIAADHVEVVTEAETPPFMVEDRVEVDETLRLTYRYLDLRRPEMTETLRLRHRVFESIRRFFDERGFVDVETPMLTKSTPEGARDFLVPSRLQRGKVYALPQSPQLFKQLLMVAGLDRYYQLVRCFRDEDLRADRHWEFTQLDLEMSFATEEDLYEVVESMFARTFAETLQIEVPTPFPRLTHDEAMRRYGSDKPDTRYAMELAELTDAFRGSGFRAFAGVVADGGVVKGFAAPGAAGWSRSDLDRLVQEAKARGAAGLVWMAFTSDGARSPVEKHLSAPEVDAIRTATGAAEGDLALIVADRPTRVGVALDGLRRVMADRLHLVPDDHWNFVWITDMPLWEWSEEEQTWVPGHHPFTSPASDDLQPETAKARAYDITLNGYELGSGSIRIHEPEVQRKIFEMIGLSEDEAKTKFGFLLEAFRFGVPPHGGIAIGMDRVVMMMGGRENIRDVIAFPKTASGTELLTGAPTDPTAEQLRNLGVRFAGE
ncbi:MAG: aspartate--tRNA ligase [Actinomycetota bacterium]